VAIVLSNDNTMVPRYRRDKQKLQIESQTIQWPQDTDEINRSYKSKVRQYNGHKILTTSTEVTNRYFCGHYIVWPSICSFCLSSRYLVAIVLSDLRFVASVYLVGILWQLHKQYNGHKILTRSTEATNQRSDNTMATRYRRDKQKLQIEG
jgi:hypothetical protein